MGHDITAIRDYTKYNNFWKTKNCLENAEKMRLKLVIAYLRRSMNSETIHKFYKFIYSKNDNGVSGSGASEIINLDTLKEALQKVKDSDFDEEDKKDYSDFLKKCVKWCKKEKKAGVIIQFG